jgi:hypothetical protein
MAITRFQEIVYPVIPVASPVQDFHLQTVFPVLMEITSPLLINV